MVSRSPHRSPPRDAENPAPPPPMLQTADKPPSPLALAVVAKLDQGGGVVDGRDSDKGSRVVAGILRRDRREAALRRSAVGVRIAAVILSLISFSVMASDKTEGWAGDYFGRYQEYRYCVAVNVIVFVYSGFQVYAWAHHMITKRHIIHRPFRSYFDFAMDQILAYLLMSASSSAATRNNDWVSSWGSDEFTDHISGSVAMSFLAFMALALSSLISAHDLFSRSL